MGIGTARISRRDFLALLTTCASAVADPSENGPRPPWAWARVSDIDGVCPCRTCLASVWLDVWVEVA